MENDPEILRAALLWARNHIDVVVSLVNKDAILKRLDDVIGYPGSTVQTLQQFREKYPIANYTKGK